MIDELNSIKKRLKELGYATDEELLYGLHYELKRLVDLLIEEEQHKKGDGK